MALTTVANVKTYLGISVSTYDTLLTEILDAVSDAIEKYCDRTFAQADYTEFRLFSDDLTTNFKVQQHPITMVYAAAWGNTEMVEVDYNATDTTFYQVNIDTDRLTVAANAAQNSYTLSDYADIEALFDAVLVDYAGFTVTYRDDWYKQLPPWVLIPDAYSNILNTSTSDTSFYGCDRPLRLFKDGERIFRVPDRLSEGTPLVVRYQAGYSTIPDSLIMTCKKLCQGVWERSGQGAAVTGTVQREKIGKYEVESSTGASLTRSSSSRGVKGLVSGLFTSDIMYELDIYRNKDLA